jgi:hypothetical protein
LRSIADAWRRNAGMHASMSETAPHISDRGVLATGGLSASRRQTRRSVLYSCPSSYCGRRP